jgi:demethylmenaquinone methyltransferase / 2-methoxy-6-polyprenyl-1,4-benzoquinol methylase
MTDPDPKVVPHPTLSRYYDEASQRPAFVRQIFDETAQWYDRIIAIPAFGSGNWYRRQSLLRIGLEPGMRVLDVATGTGVVAREAVKMTGRQHPVFGLDPSIGMLLQARKIDGVAPLQGVGESLPFRDATFDALTIGFALRHLADLLAAFTEYRRVLRPGAKILILEITPPRSRFGRATLGFYMNRVVPAIARVVTGSRKAKTLMEYYWDTTDTCVPPAAILEALSAAGFEKPSRRVELGVFSEYTASVPAE